MSSNERWTIAREGVGSFLDPPGSPQHNLSVVGRYKNNGNEFASMSLEGAVETEWVPEGIKRAAQKKLDEAEYVMSEAWVRHAYGYFKNCYSPDGVNRNVSDCIIDNTHSLPAEHHLAFLLVKKYFPDAEPRLDLIEDASGGYGSHPCAKCGRTVQYEARYDAWAEYGMPPDCPEGGNHE